MRNSDKFKFTLSVFAGALICLTAFSALLLSAQRVSADTTANVNVSIDIPAHCSLTVNPDNQSTTVDPGNTATLTTQVKAVCNDPAGLAVYSVGYTNETYGNNNFVGEINNNTYLIPSDNQPTPTTSQWNMRIEPVNGDYIPTVDNSFNTAQIVPTQYTKVAHRDTATDMGNNAVGAKFNAIFSIFVDHTQIAGTYTAKVKFLLVHPSTHAAPITPVAVPHQICYYGNGEDEGTMACQSKDDINGNNISANIDVRLRAPNFSRAGYGFTGWNTKEDGSGTQYGPMETITFTQEMYNKGLMLFANWKTAETDVTMQTFDDTASPYASAAIGTVIALKDTRDSDVYAVAKLADGKWWMIENLRLDYDATRSSTDVDSSQGYGGVFAGLAEPESANFSNSTIANSLYTTDTSSTDLRIITGSNQGYRFPRYNNSNTASRVTNYTSSDANIYSYGNYYTWAAAIANTTAYSASNQSATTTSLCPTGWHLPTGGNNKNNLTSSEWWTLIRTIVGANPANYDSSAYPTYTDSSSSTEGTNASKLMRRYPTNFVYSRRFHNSSTIGGSFYWSSTVYYGEDAFYSALNDMSVAPGTQINYKSYGGTIRCIAN